MKLKLVLFILQDLRNLAFILQVLCKSYQLLYNTKESTYALIYHSVMIEYSTQNRSYSLLLLKILISLATALASSNSSFLDFKE